MTEAWESPSLLLWALLWALLLALLLALLFRRLVKSEERFRLIADNSSDLVGLHSPEGAYLWVSPSVVRILGYKPEDMIGKDASYFIHPEDKKQMRGPQGPPYHSSKVTYRIRRKDGFYVWLETLTSPVLNSKGKVVQLIAASREVSERMESDYLYRLLIRNLPNTSVLLFDPNFHHSVAEGAMTLGVPEGVLTFRAGQRTRRENRTLWEVFPEDIAGTLLPYYEKVFQGHSLSIRETFRARVYESHFSPIRGLDGTIKMGMAVFVDVSKEVTQRRDLEDRTADLMRSNRDLEQFANVASHELKAPLRRITSFADLLLEEYRPSLPWEAREYLGHITEGVEAFRSVVDSLLVYSRVSTDRTKIEIVDTNLVYGAAIRNLSPLLKETGATVEKRNLPDRLLADKTLLRQLFENLIGNAVKFNNTGRYPLVVVDSHRDLLAWEFSIQDNGPGLDDAYQEKVFTMFQRLRSDVEGAGIGLALCKKIVGIHRGDIWFESSGDSGTTFKFTFPANLR